MFIFCFIWSVKIEFASQVGEYSFPKTTFLAFKDSYDFTWGEDLSGWLDASSNSSGLIDVIWLLIANVCFLNLMISISGAVFGETAENWESGDMEIKNELVLYCERLYLPFNYWNDEEGQKRQHIVYVEEDHDRPDKEVSD